jgi:hypothetical protein
MYAAQSWSPDGCAAAAGSRQSSDKLVSGFEFEDEALLGGGTAVDFVDVPGARGMKRVELIETRK